MTTFAAYAAGFEIHPQNGVAAQHLAVLFGGLGRVDFTLSVGDPTVNQGQMISISTRHWSVRCDLTERAGPVTAASGNSPGAGFCIRIQEAHGSGGGGESKSGEDSA